LRKIDWSSWHVKPIRRFQARAVAIYVSGPSGWPQAAFFGPFWFSLRGWSRPAGESTAGHRRSSRKLGLATDDAVVNETGGDDGAA